MTDAPDSLEALHEWPWSEIEGAHVRVEQEVTDDLAALARPPSEPPPEPTIEEREGELVGRAEGTGLYFSEEHGLIPDGIGPAIFLSTPEDTVLEVRTDRLENELLAFEPAEGDEEC